MRSVNIEKGERRARNEWTFVSIKSQKVCGFRHSVLCFWSPLCPYQSFKNASVSIRSIWINVYITNFSFLFLVNFQLRPVLYQFILIPSSKIYFFWYKLTKSPIKFEEKTQLVFDFIFFTSTCIQQFKSLPLAASRHHENGETTPRWWWIFFLFFCYFLLHFFSSFFLFFCSIQFNAEMEWTTTQSRVAVSCVSIRWLWSEVFLLFF